MMKMSIMSTNCIGSYYPERGSTSGIKDAAAKSLGHSDVVFLSNFSDKHQIKHQTKCLINKIFVTFDINCNYFHPVMPKTPKMRMIKCQGIVSIKI